MVAHQYFDNTPEPVAPAAPPTTPPPKRFRRGLIAAVAALTVASGAGSGAIAAGLIDHSTASASAGTALPTTPTPTSSTSSSTAGNIYKQDLPGVAAVPPNLSEGHANGPGNGLADQGA